MIYIFDILWSILFYTLSINSHKVIKFFFWFVSLTPLFLTVVLRGNVGVDTNAYISRIELMRDMDWNSFSLDPLFFLSSKTILLVLQEPLNVVIAFGFLNFIFLLYTSLKLNKNGIVFFLLITPIFLLDFTMNTIRVGTALTFFLYSFHAFLEGKKTKGAIFSIIAILFHFSIVYLIIVLALYFSKLNFKSIFIIFIILITLIISSSILLKDRLAFYENFSPPSSFSGLTPLIIIFLLTSILTIKLRAERLKFLFTISLFTIAVIPIVIISYAGLRLLWLNLFFILIMIFYFLKNKMLNMSNTLYISFLFVGVVGFILITKGYFSTKGTGYSPFLPYKFYTDYK